MVGWRHIGWLVVGISASIPACRETRRAAPPSAASPAPAPAAAPTKQRNPRLDEVAEVILLPAGREAVRVEAEVARRPADRARGLMFRRALPEGEGMLFLFERSDRHAFYMKNTYVALDLIHLDVVEGEGRVVGVLEDMRPHDERSRRIDEPSWAVLEVPSRFCRRHGITAGTPVVIVPSTGR